MAVLRFARGFVDRRPALKDKLRPIVRYGRIYLGAILQFGRIRMARAKHGPFKELFESSRGVGASPAEDRSIVMLAVADLRFDPRIEREARALAAAGYAVTVVVPRHNGWKDARLDWGPGITFDGIPTYAGDFAFTFPGIYGEAFLYEALRYRPFAFHAHDLQMAYVGIAAAKTTGAHLVCDFHEWFSENVTYNARERTYQTHSSEQKQVFKWLESEALRQASEVVTVCDSIADAMADEFETGRRPVVVRNIPNFRAEPTSVYKPLKQQFGIPDDRFVVLYQGGLGPSRFLEPVIEALGIAKRCVLVVRGPSIETYGPEYRRLAANAGAADRLILAPPVPSRDVVAAARGADAGLYTVLGVGRNFIYALPNKIFEYMAAGLPILSADYPEARRIVEDNEVGLVFDPKDPASIAAAIDRLIDERDLQRRFAVNTAAALVSIDADREWQKLVEAYNRLTAPLSESP